MRSTEKNKAFLNRSSKAFQDACNNDENSKVLRTEEPLQNATVCRERGQ